MINMFLYLDIQNFFFFLNGKTNLPFRYLTQVTALLLQIEKK